MSSRSFRRRNSRRRRRPDADARPGVERAPGAPGDRPGSDPGRRNGAPQPPDAVPGRAPQNRRARNGTGPGHGARAPEVGLQRPEQPLVFPDCPICSQPVRDLASALTHHATGGPAHFECILQELRESNEMLPQERLCYLGGGCFGILEMRPAGGPAKFVIRKRIQYEEKDAKQEWKKPLLYSL